MSNMSNTPSTPGQSSSGQSNAPAPRIVIDDDWKAQAQRERDRLAAKEKEEAAKKASKARASGPMGVLGGAATSGSGPGSVSAGQQSALGTSPQGSEEEAGLPEANFQTLVGTMVTQALMYMGAFPDPQTGRAMVSLEYARFHIELLAVLEEKTRGNLEKQDADDLKAALNELRMRFVEIAKAIAQASRDGRLKAGGAGGPAGIVGGGMAGGMAGGMGGGMGGGLGGISGPGTPAGW